MSEKKRLLILSTALNSVEQQHQSLVIITKPGLTVEDYLVPEAYASIAGEIRVWDRIELIAEDGSFVAELFVRAKSRQWVQVELLHLHKFDSTVADGQDESDGIVIKWRGNIMQWCVVREEDDSNLMDTIESESSAMKLKEEYVKSMGL